jgi:hypothetical protein
MSRIVSPAPPIKIYLEIDRVTGVANMKCSEAIPVETLLKTFEAMKISVMQTRLREVIEKRKPSAVDLMSICSFELAVMSHASLLLQTIEERLKAIQNPAGNSARNSAINPTGNPNGSEKTS